MASSPSSSSSSRDSSASSFGRDSASRLSTISRKLVESPSFRRSFHNDPIGTVNAMGFGEIDTKEVDALYSLSDNEIRALESIQRKIEAAGDPNMLSDTNGSILF